MLAIPEIRAFVPLLKVRDVTASTTFYEKLGFSVSNSFTPEESSEPRWASLTAGNVEVMLGRADQADGNYTDEFYLYCEDVAKMHSDLLESGVAPGPISKPFFNPSGEFDVLDPDGRVVHIA